jgi:hypothetical protein
VNYELYSNTFYLFFGDTYNSCCCFWHVRFSNGFWLMGLLVLILNVFVFGECVGVFVLSDNDSQLTEAHNDSLPLVTTQMTWWSHGSTTQPIWKMKVERDHVIAVSQAWNMMEHGTNCVCEVTCKRHVKHCETLASEKAPTSKVSDFHRRCWLQESEAMSDMIIWLVVWNHGILFFHILGISYYQLTNSIIFQRGRLTTNQIIYH